MKKLEMNDDLKLKVLKLASEICSMNGSEAGGRCCQDWSGDEKLNPSKYLTKEERKVVSYNYEIHNSGLSDYDEEYDGLHDEMVASFSIAEMLRDMIKEVENQSI